MGVQVIPILIQVVYHSLPFPFQNPCFIPIPMGFPWVGIPIQIGNLNPIHMDISIVICTGAIDRLLPMKTRLISEFTYCVECDCKLYSTQLR